MRINGAIIYLINLAIGFPKGKIFFRPNPDSPLFRYEAVKAMSSCVQAYGYPGGDEMDLLPLVTKLIPQDTPLRKIQSALQKQASLHLKEKGEILVRQMVLDINGNLGYVTRKYRSNTGESILEIQDCNGAIVTRGENNTYPILL